MCRVAVVVIYDSVSIHAPLRREERQLCGQPRVNAERQQFQSTPPSEREERRDPKRSFGHGQNSFNPRPPPKRGATVSLPTSRLSSWSFNPRPPPKRGATLLAEAAAANDDVSIHAPLRREERRACKSR